MLFYFHDLFFIYIYMHNSMLDLFYKFLFLINLFVLYVIKHYYIRLF